MQLRLHDVVVNETPKFQYLNPTNLSHSISMRGDNVYDFLIFPLDSHGVVSCFPTFKPSQEEFETCDRYELTYETPEYDPSAKTFHDQDVKLLPLPQPPATPRARPHGRTQAPREPPN
jgi:hypothetical protein